MSDLCAILESYLEPRDVADVYSAYLFGAEAHEGQRRVSGEPYIYHPIEVARILAEMRLDAKSITAAILHDVIEDTPTAKERIAEEFGDDVAELVDGVSKITRIEFQSQEEAQAENFRKMLLAMASDIRVILIKLADRLHNMRTIAALSPERRRAMARETLDIYAPIANRLGVRQWAAELGDLGFSALYPLRYRIIADAVRKRHGNRKAIVEKIRSTIVSQLEREGLPAEVTGREKGLYGVYRKMEQKHLSFEQVYDIHGFRVIVDQADTCYRTLGVIHNLYKPIPGRFKDYIAIPKANGYQSLHTVVFGPFGVSLEVQIRTREMDRVAEAGVASHWLYKSGERGSDPAQQRALQWLKDLLDTQQKAGNPREFLEHLKVDLFPDEVYVFTPNGEIKKLPRDATVIDFAYDVHTDVGNRCVGAKVNHQLVPLRTTLRNGDHVEIITSPNSRPNPAWLNYVVTGKARAHIRNFLKNQKVEESAKLGERLLATALEDIGADLQKLPEETRQALLKTLKLKTWNDLLGEIGLGNRLASMVARQLVPQIEKDEASRFLRLFRRRSQKPKEPVLAIHGTEGVVVTYARCCRPIPGDPILGFLTAGRGIVVHTEDCPNVVRYRKHPEQWIDVQWEKDIKGVYPVYFRVEAKNQRGVLASVAAAISEQDANIDTVTFDDRDGQYTAMDFTVEVRDRVHLAHIMRRIRALESVVRINRKKG
ncbi:MAG: bifunctional GTP diphosphokinase/guanosine-3',5'-bis(diphosphate) 3'-diphosphatase [Candidatus Muproteobacteria bacterium RIFCSPHIGHO2_02_FULL_60_13]|uniref:Bifunctional GTP diphosphokinase/guanosine-3',5'-bis(Diphosphate) 3'-diphosphatase n=1 Tax=Candidatus Muproteobacteria bacterium RIFCSPLOWO2_01_FULL_60_18 TaxID=1817768 RepID=A0A1F6TWX0_9PROT|nr:MAG: bifunctional GTP diphosphokinase/guanosine-3',5'-bis(diphosphate) 3'-diphosphatase [Candidatus Muproteobacteria bacterium RIFCSPHIGHO2_01_60_12]OGI49569.1 MAG: bifunctional GTP diphosphokinase/guanosine-3',5'-bis(diphosphate) 3'-diphosphatase [Candidatus Muproteobacteria bacterium RIFCSPLOWO2_01_FULL_60_18]OGI55726.1 MAG: bifunctional GTP diphosphokinase/guanosine-3',5'-bis(diphosphate) 3'-diphosphatase [Candidatus Muproteobacteria bacterium RIFCSPHIGHO2_02_FULL_60_13]